MQNSIRPKEMVQQPSTQSSTQLESTPLILHHSINSYYLNMNYKRPDLLKSLSEEDCDEDSRYTYEMLGGSSAVGDSHLRVPEQCYVPLHPEFWTHNI